MPMNAKYNFTNDYNVLSGSRLCYDDTHPRVLVVLRHFLPYIHCTA